MVTVVSMLKPCIWLISLLMEYRLARCIIRAIYLTPQYESMHLWGRGNSLTRLLSMAPIISGQAGVGQEAQRPMDLNQLSSLIIVGLLARTIPINRESGRERIYGN